MKRKSADAQVTCCKYLLAAKKTASPFTPVIATGYYDGETHGFTRCGKCAEAFTFKLAAWDRQEDIRVFVLYPMPTESFDLLFSTLPSLENPKSSYWLPNFQSFDPDKRKTALGVINRLEELRLPPAMVVATRHMQKRLIAVSTVVDKDSDYLPSDSSTGTVAWKYWKKRLGL